MWQPVTRRLLPKSGELCSQAPAEDLSPQLFMFAVIWYRKDAVHSPTIPLPYIDLSDVVKDDESSKMKEKGEAQNKLTLNIHNW